MAQSTPLGGPVVLVVEDGPLQRMLAVDLARERSPSIGIIVTSGKAARAPLALPEGSVFLSKPYDHGELTGLLHQLINRTP